jgi:hypothetical protein
VRPCPYPPPWLCSLDGGQWHPVPPALVGELAAIDENLIRHELTAAEQALAIQRRAELIAAIEAEGREKANNAANAAPSRQAQRRAGVKTGRDPGSNRSLGEIGGVSEKTVRRARKRAEALGTEALERVVGTSLAKPGELDALVSLPAPEREAVIASIEVEATKPEPERRKISAVAIVRERAATIVADADPAPAGPTAPAIVSVGLRRLQIAWEQASMEERACVGQINSPHG